MVALKKEVNREVKHAIRATKQKYENKVLVVFQILFQWYMDSVQLFSSPAVETLHGDPHPQERYHPSCQTCNCHLLPNEHMNMNPSVLY